ncbi:MAG: TlyA family RNA methyltransferase [Deltaproteobacteria bacterium]|nr:TlyA family RNA methyltransferase [Deltaproteobacteria bacterium]MBZ0219761.1 TlyA family RNA methyltransferase [Deltaproteobacteria bacterium]
MGGGQKRKKERIDSLLVEKGLVQSRQKAQALIMAGKVFVEGALVDKPGREIDPESEISLKEGLPFVGRGGVKLASFLDQTGLDVAGMTALDIGASTGGFTDCLLKRGAAKVYAVDVGKGLIDQSLRSDPRVVVLEERNIRYLDPSEVGGPVDLAVIDVSFISLEKVLPKVREFLKEKGAVLALIKPQFEVGKGQVGKGGVVRDPRMHAEVVERIARFSEGVGYRVVSRGESPITGAKGNREFWIFLEKIES